MIVLLVMTDGRRDLLRRSVESFQYLEGPITRRIIHDDSGDLAYQEWLWETYPTFEVIGGGERKGFDGAYRRVWAMLAAVKEPHVFSTEDDMIIERPVNLDDMAAVLDANPHIAQIALRRQAVNDLEKAAGGIVELNPDAYQEHYDGLDYWLEHRQFFTTNSSLFRRELCKRGWPEGSESEGRFGIELFKDPVIRSAFWGKRSDPPLIRHIGEQRIGYGY